MKTITLTEEAYERLLSWKNSTKDSFSKVVLKKVPKRGTLGDLAEGIKQLAPMTEKQFKLMEKSLEYGRTQDWQRDPWNT